MINSEGRGMQADSMDISMAMPTYPVLVITVLIKTKSSPTIFSIYERRARKLARLLLSGRLRPYSERSEETRFVRQHAPNPKGSHATYFEDARSSCSTARCQKPPSMLLQKAKNPANPGYRYSPAE